MDVTVEVDFPQGDGGRLRLVAASAVDGWQAYRPEKVIAAIDAADAAARAGHWVVGLLAYEAAPAFDAALLTRRALPSLPLAAFFTFPANGINAPARTDASAFECGHWRADDPQSRVREMVGIVREGIAAGTYYQVNASTRLRAAFSGDAGSLFRALAAAQPDGYCARIATPEWEVHSVSPELFFDWRDDRLITRPMKGTAPRFAEPARDEAARATMLNSAKERAENVMIVDLIRNDLSRIARTGSVRVPALFEAHGLPTVWQMTSTVECRTRDDVGLSQVFGALFPCGSVTGAPKVSAMQAICALESSPRGVYCGAVGVIRPGGHATFNVAIRTVTLDKRAGRAECGVGSGITIHSSAGAEYSEWVAKRRFLLRAAADFELLETMLLHEGTVWLWPEHRTRLCAAAEHFGFAVDEAVLNALRVQLEQAHPDGAWRVRLLCRRDGRLRTQVFALEPSPGEATVVLATSPVQSDEEFLRWKTTARGVYAPHQPPAGAFDTLLWNERGELTEFTRGNVVLEVAGRRLTPPTESGLLAGAYRQVLLAAGEIEEAVLRVEDLRRATRAWFINSVRGWVSVRVVER